jgi:hypothetical protein
LKGNDENSRIRIHLSEAWIRGSGSTPKCHGSATLLKPLQIKALYTQDLLQCCGSVSLMRIRFVNVDPDYCFGLDLKHLFYVLFICVLGCRRSPRSTISTSSRRFASRRIRRSCSTTASPRTTGGRSFGTRWSWISTR